ncbi:MAG: hypothetical protein H7840_05760 [Alphaproteobacteria bacterium]
MSKATKVYDEIIEQLTVRGSVAKPRKVTTIYEEMTTRLKSSDPVSRKRGYETLYSIVQTIAMDAAGTHKADEIADAAIEAGLVRDALKSVIEHWAR